MNYILKKSWLNRLSTVGEKTFVTLLILSVLLYELLLSFHGFDLCDEGWLLSGFQQIFNEPSSVEYQLLYYNSLVVGGIWNLIFGSYGIFAFRILSVLAILLSSLCVYYTLRKIVGRWYIWTGLMSVLFCYDYGIFVFHHNYLTILLCCVAVYFLYRGLLQSSLFSIFISFFFVGVNVFSRLPNVTMLALGLIVFVDYYYKRDKHLLYRQLFVGLSGFVTGIASVIICMHLFGHWTVFKDSFSNLLSVGTADDSTHQFSHLVKIYCYNYYSILRQIGLVLSPMILYFVVIRFVEYRLWKICLMVICGLAFIFSYLHFAETISFVYGFATLVLVYSFYQYRKNRELFLICLLAFLVMYLLPLGSDFGIGNMGISSIWIALPLSIGLLGRELKRCFCKWQMAVALGCLLILIVFWSKLLWTVSHSCYFDSGCRFEKRYQISNSLATTYTTKDKVAIMDDLLGHLSHYVKENDYLLCFQSSPMIHYLTKTRPYVFNSWVWTYDTGTMERQFQRAKKVHGVLPVILREKCQPIGGEWTVPIDYFDITTLPETFVYKGGKIDVIKKFILDNHYTVAWENELFQILTPETIISH